MLAIASLTVREAVRRRVVIATALMAFAIVGLTAWGFVKLHATLTENGRDPADIARTFSVLTITLGSVFSMVLAIGSAFLAAPAIGGDLESGLLLAIVPRPIRRAEIVLGKWLGLLALLVAFVFVTGGAELAAIAAISGYAPPHPLVALGFLAAQAVAMATLALALGTRFAPVACGVVALALFGFAWISGISGTVAASLGNAWLVHAGTVVSLLIPTDGLWREARAALEPVVIAAASATPESARLLGPFAGAAPPVSFVVWSFGWIALVLFLAVTGLRTRDI